MKNLTFANKTIITFHAKPGSGLFDSLTEAKIFINNNDLEDCYVIVDGFSFYIEKYSDIVEKIKEYKDGMTDSDFRENLNT